MSHFSVILATKEFPTEKVIRKEMQPFHEFECTGIDDRYVQDLDVTDAGDREKRGPPNRGPRNLYFSHGVRYEDEHHYDRPLSDRSLQSLFRAGRATAQRHGRGRRSAWPRRHARKRAGMGRCGGSVHAMSFAERRGHASDSVDIPGVEDCVFHYSLWGAI